MAGLGDEMSESLSPRDKSSYQDTIIEPDQLVRMGSLMDDVSRQSIELLNKRKTHSSEARYQDILQAIDALRDCQSRPHLGLDTRAMLREIKGFMRELQAKKTTVPSAIELMARLVDMLANTKQTPVPFEYNVWAHEGDIQRLAFKLITQHCHTVLHFMQSELQERTPIWNPSWVQFKNLLGPLLQEARKDKAPSPILVNLLSHVLARLYSYWNTYRVTIKAGLPPEVRDMIFREVLEGQRLRPLPPHDLQWPRWEPLKIICNDCSQDCPVEWSWVVDEMHPYEWKLQKVHGQPCGRTATLVTKHSSGCQCRRPVSARKTDTIMTQEAMEVNFDPVKLLSNWDRLKDKDDII